VGLVVVLVCGPERSLQKRASVLFGSVAFFLSFGVLTCLSFFFAFCSVVLLTYRPQGTRCAAPGVQRGVPVPVLARTVVCRPNSDVARMHARGALDAVRGVPCSYVQELQEQQTGRLPARHRSFSTPQSPSVRSAVCKLWQGLSWSCRPLLPPGVGFGCVRRRASEYTVSCTSTRRCRAFLPAS
jgi:hypothetical protein